MQNGIRSIQSKHSVQQTISNLTALLSERGIKLFCVIDHSAEAHTSGLAMPNTKVLVFGDAKAGTPLMIARPSVALDLPLRILVAETTSGETLLTWNEPEWLQERHGLPEGLIKNVAAAEALAKLAIN